MNFNHTFSFFDMLPHAYGYFDGEGNLIAANKMWGDFFPHGAGFTKFEDFFPDQLICGLTRAGLFNHVDLNGDFECFWSPEGNADNKNIAALDIALRKTEYKGGFALLATIKNPSASQDDSEGLRAQEEVNKIFLDASPLVMNVWNENYQIVRTSPQAPKLFGLSSMDEYLDKFHKLSPEFQPCGERSSRKAIEFVKYAFDVGQAKFEWLHQDLQGNPIPTEITLTRYEHGGECFLASYAADLRAVENSRQVQEQLKASQSIRDIFDATPLPTTLYDVNMNVLESNLECAKLFGFDSKEEFMQGISGKFFEFAPPNQPCGTSSLSKSQVLIQNVLLSGRAQFEWTIQRQDGTTIPIEATATATTYQGALSLIITARDLTESLKRRQLEQEARDAMSRQLQIYNASPIPSSLWSAEFAPVDCNDAMIKLLKMDSKDDFLHRFAKFNPPMQSCGLTTAEKVAYIATKIFEEGVCHYDWEFLDADGNLVPGKCIGTRIDLEETSFLSIHFQDMREVYAAQEREKEVSERFRLMVDAAPLIIQYWDENGTAVDCNQTTLDFYNCLTREEYFMQLPNTLTGTLQPCGTDSWKRWNDFIAEVFEKGSSKIDFVENDPSGSLAFFETSGIATTYGGYPVALTYSNDVTEVKEAKEKEKELEIAKESDQAKSRFLARMSHEIRTPITAVMGISEIQLQKPDLSSHTEEAFAKIYNSSALLLRIINDILDLSRIESGKMSLLSEEYETEDLITNIIHLHQGELASKYIGFNLSVDRGLPAKLLGDGIRIEQVINNLLSNASKYTEKGQVELVVQNIPHPEASDQTILRFVVKDTGSGMTPQQTEAIFAEYTRFHEDNARYIAGTGLGMAIVSSLVQLMDGEIQLESTEGEGTIVTVDLPQRIYDDRYLGEDVASRLERFEASARYNRSHFQTLPEPMPYGKVLVVDDTESNLYVAKGLLDFYGITVEACTNGQDAIDKIKAGNVYDIVFMDHMMPVMDGMETMKILRSMGYRQPIIALTANAIIGKAKEFVKSGFDAFISKPIDTKRLDSVLNKYIRDKQPKEVREAAQNTTNTSKANSIDDFQISTAVLDKFKKDFAEKFANAGEDIRKHLTAEDFKAAHILVHTIKGMANMMKQTQLAEAGKDMEELLENGIAPAAQVVETFEKELASLLSAIAPPDNLSHDKTAILSHLNTLIPLLEQQKADSLTMLAPLQNIPQAAILIKQIQKLDFATAAKSAATLRDIL
ncbi:MAG: ATP-binding protein [Defluviitaleaceae bacterium]|nr:ATP-binding protein [Defluviitaleaceae bacterium]